MKFLISFATFVALAFAGTVKQESSGLGIQELKKLDASVSDEPKYLWPKEDMKTRGLYLAAMRTEGGYDPLGAMILINATKRIVASEIQDRVGVSSGNRETGGILDSLYLTLENLIKGPVVVPGPDEHQEQIEFAESFTADLTEGKYGNWSKLADRYFEVALAFKLQTSQINQITPIDSDEEVDGFYKGAQIHYSQNNEMWSLVEKLMNGGVTQVKGGFHTCKNHRCRFEEMQKMLKEIQKGQKH